MDSYIDEILHKLSDEDNLRRLKSAVNSGRYVDYGGRRYINMSSNDYLGLSGNIELQELFFKKHYDSSRFLMSNSASRLMSGNSEDYDILESSLSKLYHDKFCLVLNSGYAVNSGLLPAITSKDDLVIADRLLHASLIDGMRLCSCRWQRYRHNDMEHLETLLKRAKSETKGRVWVVTESIFSMDGDRARLKELLSLKQRYGFYIYLDEAHAFGVEGKEGAGYASKLGVDGEIDIIVATFGKALASFGAFAAISDGLRELLVNRMRTLIFTTALPPINLLWTNFIVEQLGSFEQERSNLRYMVNKLAPNNEEASHIIPILTYENSKAVALSERFKEGGYWAIPIRYPTVPKGEARVRVSLSAALNEEEIDNFIAIWRDVG